MERKPYIPKKSKAQRNEDILYTLYAIGLTLVMAGAILGTVGAVYILSHFIIKYW